MAVLHDLGFTFSPPRPVDEQTNLFRIDPLRQLAASFGTPTLAQSKGKIQLGKCVMKGLHARGMIVQEGFEFFFAPALTTQPNVRAAGSTDNSAAGPTPAAATESTQAAMRKQNGALQHELAAVKESAGFDPKPGQAVECTPGSEQLATPQPGAQLPVQAPTPPGAVGGVTDRRLVQLLQSNLSVLKFSRLPAANGPELPTPTPDIEGMVTRLAICGGGEMPWFGVPQYHTGRVRSGPHNCSIQVMAKIYRFHM